MTKEQSERLQALEDLVREAIQYVEWEEFTEGSPCGISDYPEKKWLKKAREVVGE